jgi:hypothetical protein
MHGKPPLQCWAREPIPANPPKVDSQEQACHQWDENAVQNVEAEQGMRTNFATAKQECPRIIYRVDSEQLMAWTFMAQQRCGPAHV